MYTAFYDFLEDYGLTDDEIFSEFQNICADLGLWLHEAVL